MIDTTVAKDFLVNFFKTNNGIPAVKVNPNCSLYDVSLALTMGTAENYEPGVSQRNQIISLVDEYDKAQANDLYFGDAFKLLDDISDTFADKIINTKSILKTIQDNVTALTEEINKQKDSILAQDPWTSKQLNKTEFNEDYSMVPWDNIMKFMSKKNIIEYANDIADTNDNNLNNITLGKVKARMPFIKLGDTLVYNTINLTSEKKNELATIINNSVNDILLEDITTVINLLTNKAIAERFVKNIATNANDINKQSTVLFTYLSDIKMISETMNKLEQVAASELSDESTTALMSNIKAMKHVVLFMTYWSLFKREIVFKDTLIMPNKAINPDNFKDFETNGGSQLMVSHFLFVQYPEGTKLPVMGITASRVLSIAKEIENKVSKFQVDTEIKLKAKINSAMRDAMERALYVFLKESSENDENCKIDMVNAKMAIDGCISNVIHTEVSLEDALYKLIIKNMYKNDFIYTVYNKLGKMYIEKATVINELTDEEIALAGNSVFTEMMVEFIKDNFLIKG